MHNSITSGRRGGGVETSQNSEKYNKMTSVQQDVLKYLSLGVEKT